MRPLVSIVTPSFNQGRYLDQAIQSVLSQDYRRVELIVIDGGSTDGSVGLIEKHGSTLAYWVSEKDAGPADALIKGFARATGEILGVLNADDFLLPGSLARVVREFEANPGVDVISGHGYFANAAGELGEPTFSDSWNLRRFCNGACVLVQQATFFRRPAYDRAGGFRRTGRVCWDMELWADLARTGARFHLFDDHLAAFRVHEDSITGSAELRRRRREDARAVMAEMRGHPESKLDRWRHLSGRFLKFCRHPRRTLRQRRYFHRLLHRWSL